MEQEIYVGCYSENGICKFKFNNGSLYNFETNNDFENCSYLCTANDIIYSIVEYSDSELYKNGCIISRNSNLIPINYAILQGFGPCFIQFDNLRNVLYIANYGDGSIDVFSTNKNGAINSLIYHLPNYSQNSKMHCIQLSNDILFAVDLGADRLIAYKILFCETKLELKEIHSYRFIDGSAPRHLILHNNELYLVTENSCELYKFNFSEINGFTLLDCVSLIPDNIKKEKNTTGCAIKISNDGKFIYTSIRGKNFISIFTNKLELIQNISCNGITPRDIFLDNTEKFLLCANQDSNNISIFNRNINTGVLDFKDSYSINSPACII